MQKLSKDEMKKVLGGVVAPPPAGQCNVTCKTNYYACCNSNGLFDATCECYADGSSHSCDNGGSGASQCSNTD